MPFRALVLDELGKLLGVLSHPARLRIVEELQQEERDVNALSETVGIAQSGVSHHLALLRARHLVFERREGRHVFYRLTRPEMAAWLLDGLRFIEPLSEIDLSAAVAKARAVWSTRKPAKAATKIKTRKATRSTS